MGSPKVVDLERELAYLWPDEEQGGYNLHDSNDNSQGIQLTQPSAQMTTELNDADDAKLWPPNVEKLFIQLMVEEMAMPKAKEFRRKGCENYIKLGTLFNKTTATGVMAFASTQDPTNTDEERELDERFITIGVHVDVDMDVDVEVDPNIGEGP
uniref:Uncharacterized protein n=1 Tax=Fagus sylvatica TaxID=28930 RepID=A0A2N9H4I8_FAGSY